MQTRARAANGPAIVLTVFVVVILLESSRQNPLLLLGGVCVMCRLGRCYMPAILYAPPGSCSPDPGTAYIRSLSPQFRFLQRAPGKHRFDGASFTPHFGCRQPYPRMTKWSSRNSPDFYAF